MESLIFSISKKTDGVFYRDPEKKGTNIITILPEGYRPAKTLLVPTVVTYVPNQIKSMTLQREKSKILPNMLLIYPDGRILLQNPRQASDEDFYSDMGLEQSDFFGDESVEQRVTQYVSVQGVNFRV